MATVSPSVEHKALIGRSRPGSISLPHSPVVGQVKPASSAPLASTNPFEDTPSPAPSASTNPFEESPPRSPLLTSPSTSSNSTTNPFDDSYSAGTDTTGRQRQQVSPHHPPPPLFISQHTTSTQPALAVKSPSPVGSTNPFEDPVIEARKPHSAPPRPTSLPTSLPSASQLVVAPVSQPISVAQGRKELIVGAHKSATPPSTSPLSSVAFSDTTHSPTSSTRSMSPTNSILPPTKNDTNIFDSTSSVLWSASIVAAAANMDWNSSSTMVPNDEQSEANAPLISTQSTLQAGGLNPPEDSQTLPLEDDAESSKTPTVPQDRRIPINAEGYAVISTPKQLHGLLAKNIPSGLKGITAGPCIFDWDEKNSKWELNSQGDTTIIPPAQQELARLKREQEEAVRKQNFELAAEIADQQEALRKGNAPTYSAQMTPTLALCFVNDTWELQNVNPVSNDDNILPSIVTNAFKDLIESTRPASNSISQLSSTFSSFLGLEPAETATNQPPPQTTTAPTQISASSSVGPTASSSTPTPTTKPTQQSSGVFQVLGSIFSIRPEPPEDPSKKIEQLLGNLKTSITTLTSHLLHAPGEEDKPSSKTSKLVRYDICSAIADCMFHYFMRPTRVHIWNFIEEVAFAPKSAPLQMPVFLSPSGASSTLTSAASTSQEGSEPLRGLVDRIITVHKDNNMKFRALVCEALNSGKLGAALNELFTNPLITSKYYKPLALVRTPQYCMQFTSAFNGLSHFRFSFKLNFELIYRT
ncbi:hypothetical protein Pelo_11343 [Pelomyxa schiedti]|nr:hypothetical protein Pelo_11343 [Pelomyxa schiedti]